MQLDCVKHVFGAFGYYTGCSGKIEFFHSSLQPFPRLHIAVRDLQSSQRSASVQSLLLAGLFCTTNSRRVLARERWETLKNSWEKTQYLMNTLYLFAVRYRCVEFEGHEADLELQKKAIRKN